MLRRALLPVMESLSNGMLHSSVGSEALLRPLSGIDASSSVFSAASSPVTSFLRGKLYVSSGMRIQPQSRLRVVDNTGAVEALTIPSSFRGRTARVGTMITVAIKKARGESKAPKGTVQRGVIVSTRGSWRRLSGATVTGPDNQLVIIDQKGLPVGTRIKGIVPWEIRRSLGRLGARLLLIADGVA